MAKLADAPEQRERADEQQATVEAGSFQATFKIPGRVSVGANEGAKSLRIATASIAPDLIIRSAPVVDPTAFIEASFVQSEDAPLLPGRVSIYRDGIFVGRGKMAAAGKDETVRLVVEMQPQTTPPTTTNAHDKRGVLEWAFEAKAAEVRDINFAWRLRWPKDKGVVMVPAG
jgi:hypothetical protein